MLVSLSTISLSGIAHAGTGGDTRALIDTARHLPDHAPEKERLYRKALALSPSDPQALFNLALLLQNNKRYAAAIPLYREVVKQDPTDAIAHYNLANILIARGDPGDWQASAWHLRQALAYSDDRQRIKRAATSLRQLESNLALLYSPYRNARYSRAQLADMLVRPDTAERVRGNSKYDGPRIPLMLNFAAQSDELTPAARQKLDDIAAILKMPALQNERIQIEGYTDSREHPEFEQRMRYAKQRAERVRQYLQEVHHLPAERFTTRAFADLEIISTNNTPQGRAANRRVELYNLSKGRKVPTPLYAN